MWPGEWNRMTMDALLKAEKRAGRMLMQNAILRLVGENMRRYYIPMKSPDRGPPHDSR